MRGVLKWVQKIEFPHIKDDQVSVHSLCYHPEGKQLVVAAGERVLIYDPDGTLLNTLKAHKDVVNCVAYARDGKKFASGAVDKTVIVWTPQLEGLLKYSHNDSVQCMAFNPVSHQLASCSHSDFAFWSADQKAVQKYKISTRVNSCSWTNDGQYLILGLANGSISIRSKLGEEKGRFDRPGGSSSNVFSLQCCPMTSTDVIGVADWGQTLSFHTLSGQMIGKERALGFDPLCLTYFPNGEYCIVSGCSDSLHLFTKEGVRLGILGEGFKSWIWSVAIHPNGQSYTIGCQNGTVACFNIVSSTVHALYRERYAFRENMCDVIIQHLISGQKVRIKCRDLVQKIAIYRNRLAVQLPERVVLYELSSGEEQPMHYKVKEKIQKKFDCSLLVVCARHIVLCQEKRLQCLDFNGILQRDWIMDSFIRYIKVSGGPAGREGLLVGLKSGQVFRIFLDNSLPLMITSVVSAVRCLDINANRTKIAVVDDTGRLVVRDIVSDTLLYQDTGVNSVTWNTHLDSMLCYTHTIGGLSIRVGSLPPRGPQNMLGVVVGLCGATAFCLRGNVMHNIPLALGATMWQFVEAGLFDEAYQVACLGVTTADWEGLAQSALEALHLNIARDAYVKVRNLPWLQFIDQLCEKQKRGEVPKEVLQGESSAYAGKYKEAARLFQKCNQPMRALEMYTDLRMFDLAQEFIKDGSDEAKRELVKKRAEWAYSVKEPRAAAELLLSAGEHQRAIDIVAEQGWADILYDIGRRLSLSERTPLESVAFNLKQLKALPLAAEIFKKLGDEAQVIQLHVEARDWTEAFRLAENIPEMLPTVNYQHAQWLAESDKFIEAHEAYLKAGRLKDANRLLKQLSTSAIEEERFLDASYFYWLLSKQYLDIYYKKDEQTPTDHHFKEYQSHLRIAKVYYAYSIIFNYMKEPFTTYSPVSLFNVSRFILNELEYKGTPKGVSLFAVLFTLAKQAKLLQANKLCLVVNKRLQSLKPPAGVQEQIDINYLNSKACKSGFNDPEELLPLCYKCSNYSQHLNGNNCPTCKQDYIFSFISFEILPLVQFHPEVDITDAEAERLLLAPPKPAEEGDPFSEDVASALPLSLDRNALRGIDPSHILIVKRREKNLKNIYYRNILPDLQVTFCPECLLVFYSEDFELQVLQKGYCPFCRTTSEKLFDEYL
ncbi:intraflagellar transport protein 122 homolog [Bactrocera neohumeralis]|uniref:intraflagellar transport protein 122 homolog n=1 Tax=Bactrocera tryoni TaxID=59916 RepID=UPI001A98939C|nr:intraflagellar transport protein 122 homolog [Bactrocera tryoni]XP_050335661.1 intraflagellar transport protein 122 homolog [Bactrocera neohumeralis]